MKRFLTEGTSVACYEVTEGQLLSEGVVKTVSAVTGLQPAIPSDDDAKMAPIMDPLATVIDPDALDRVFEDSEDTDASVTFSYHDHFVTVDNTGTIRVTPENQAADSLTRPRIPAHENRNEQTRQ